MHTNSDRRHKRMNNIRIQKTSFMSDSKWRKLFVMLAEYSYPARLKILDHDKIHAFSTDPGLHQSGRCTQDSSPLGPVAFQDIEWLFIPAADAMGSRQEGRAAAPGLGIDLDAVREDLERIGVFEYDCNDQGLTIYGYK